MTEHIFPGQPRPIGVEGFFVLGFQSSRRSWVKQEENASGKSQPSICMLKDKDIGPDGCGASADSLMFGWEARLSSGAGLVLAKPREIKRAEATWWPSYKQGRRLTKKLGKRTISRPKLNEISGDGSHHESRRKA